MLCANGFFELPAGVHFDYGFYFAISRNFRRKTLLTHDISVCSQAMVHYLQYGELIRVPQGKKLWIGSECRTNQCWRIRHSRLRMLGGYGEQGSVESQYKDDVGIDRR